ncbi:MAG: transketolase [Rhodospirillaceae bacterium]|jgi:transketolase|nr:transketolase [Rhodospirillaceae bacterium]MBT5898528.1 transketolase [Rhodospirillaceae bacterium]MBT6429736.1 transketolase [Rhodospirillaceae bacterium]MBT7759309.1 transketolase [Rhodospirillaceae bacterium]
MTPSDMKSAPEAAGHAEMANAIRFLAADAVQAANSGHPGMPMGAADMATVLFSRFMKFDPANPHWPDRDRFVLSAGHGSMLLYSLLHLTGYGDMDMGQLRNFRQLGSHTAGHPEFGAATGIETTTGPLGQGLATGVGMAIAERMLASRFGDDLMNHFTYVLAGDGCLMEGISHEAASFAGHLRLGKLIVLFDDNQISIDGSTDLTVSDDQCARFAANGWDVARVDGHDPKALEKAIAAARQSDRPSLIAARTQIGFGAPTKAGTSGAHGAPLGDEEIAAARENLDWPHPPFEVPEDVLAAWREVGGHGAADQAAWEERLDAMEQDERAAFDRAMAGDLPASIIEAMADYRRELAEEKPQLATRAASGRALEVINGVVPETVGGSADLTGSNNTLTPGLGIVTADDFSGRYIHYGVREHGMAAAMNGMALHGGIIPYSGMFLVFSDYCRGAIRLSALMGCRVIYVVTHDSIGLGEDGPTHQPVEHLAALRAMPNLNVFRPADTMETAECWELALAAKDRPSAMVLTRQGLPAVRLDYQDDNACARGAYELVAADGEAVVTLLATGSEVSIAVAARNNLQSAGIATRVVSMPCWELFEEQDESYRQQVLGPGTVRIAIEAGVSMGWDRYLGPDGGFIGMAGFGASAPAKDLFKHFGITAEAVVELAKAKLADQQD